MSKILTVADSHGSRNPLAIARKNLNHFDKIIFLGDFFDHEDGSFEDQKNIFLEVMELKKNLPGKIEVLLGNHDANYILSDTITWQPEHEDEIKSLLLRNIKNIDLMYLDGKWLFSHAGVSEIWFYNNLISHGYSSDPEILLKNKLNKKVIKAYNDRIHHLDFLDLEFTGISNYGDEVTQNPMWIRPASLEYSAVPGFNQVVGHTALPDSDRIKNIPEKGIILFIDSLPYFRNVYAEIDTETNDFKIKKVL